VMGEIGGFGGLFSLNIEEIKQPVLVSSTDGVGTKLKIAFLTGRHDTVGIDLVAMCVNDILVQGAKPLFFLDYFSTGKLVIETAEAIIRGIGEGCKQAGCALIGGETAEMPGFYGENEYDLAGFAVGVVDNSRILDGSAIHVGDQLIGLPSSGLHSNGYSLVRKILFEAGGWTVDDVVPELGKTVGEELLTPTRIYARVIERLKKSYPINGLAHITGGGIPENLVRCLPAACKAVVRRKSWRVPPVFGFLQRAGKIEENEMMRTFNNGIGMIAVVPAASTEEILDSLHAMDEEAFLIGEMVERKEGTAAFAWG
jgi:phosphoribosylformylglycinamidine cyclo-ligase